MLRGGADDAAIEAVRRAAIEGPGHAIGRTGFVRPDRPRSAIGG